MRNGQVKVLKFESGSYIKWFSITPFSKISVLTYTTTDDINRAYLFTGFMMTHLLKLIISRKKMKASFVSHQREVRNVANAQYEYELENGIQT